MEELITLLEHFNSTLKQQIELFKEFVFILDQEEKSIADYNFHEIEKSVVLKDQHIQKAQLLEENRIQILKKICYMIAFDSRGQNLSISLFKSVFKTYLENVVKLLTPDVLQQLQSFYVQFLEIANEFQNEFKLIENRLYRNQVILKKVIQQANLSVNLFNSAAEAGMNYDALGKTQSIFSQQSSITSIRVTV